MVIRWGVILIVARRTNCARIVEAGIRHRALGVGHNGPAELTLHDPNR
jgi:hypothetical protein